MGFLTGQHTCVCLPLAPGSRMEGGEARPSPSRLPRPWRHHPGSRLGPPSPACRPQGVPGLLGPPSPAFLPTRYRLSSHGATRRREGLGHQRAAGPTARLAGAIPHPLEPALFGVPSQVGCVCHSLAEAIGLSVPIGQPRTGLLSCLPPSRRGMCSQSTLRPPQLPVPNRGHEDRVQQAGWSPRGWNTNPSSLGPWEARAGPQLALSLSRGRGAARGRVGPGFRNPPSLRAAEGGPGSGRVPERQRSRTPGWMSTCPPPPAGLV